MSNFVPEKVFLRGVLLHYFNMKKTAAGSHRILVKVYGEHALAERTCQKWFAWFKSGDLGLEDEERPGQSKKFEDEELEALLDEDCCQTQEELAESLGVTRAAISKRLKAAWYIQKPGNCVLHELKPRDVERRFFMSEMLLERHKKKWFLHRVVTGDEKWIHYDNPKRKKSYVKPGQNNLKAEYLWRKGNALYFLGSEGCAVLWAAKAGWNHQWRTLPNTSNPFEHSNSRKTPEICDQTRGNNCPSWQRAAPCCYSG